MLDFAHMHATSDGAFLEPELFETALAAADEVLEDGAPFHIHFSDIAYANRNETKHLPYGEGTLRAEPLRARARSFRATRDGDLGVAGRAVEPGDLGGALGAGGESSTSRAS